ncbi:MAG: acyl-CoA dehydrogenase [Acidimicrobiia bacterium]|nr:acyl-CoA dehydrogenase family protein [bacterium]MXW57151.1 acyl-CoA dehydrogenase [Acidimicrobiia bacterium]MYB10706.1 acyl-CoA dehydrogenase [Acidimicrobiia bacterium]MYB72981.1 acyl-CoA dehydrogenase [Acidimicrobiia bacterium]MYG58185.1 acyl-CoA dehydrogenase [Acidimicrobiia bacterium]
MDIRFSAEEIAFRDELRGWLKEVLPTLGDPPDSDDWTARRKWDTGWQRMLYDAGYAGINWPSEFGGRGSTPTEHLIFLEETTRMGAPYVGMNFVGQLHAGPTLILEATPEQRARHLPAMLKGEEVWCQGFSEPNAGSDLASLSTRAIRDGDHYVVTGQKIWTSFGHVADYCELLVRTDQEAPKHRGITWLICPMDLPGIEVRPITTVAGSSEFCEVFFDEVRIPVENRVGDENDGWRVAMVTFSFERGTAFISELLGTMNQLAEMVDIARNTSRNGSSAWDDDEIRREIGRLQAEYDALWALTKRVVSQAQRTGMPGPGGSVFKLYYADVKKRMADLAHRMLEREALVLAEGSGDEQTGGDMVASRLYVLSLSIAAGTSEIQRNIIGERILGLPKER